MLGGGFGGLWAIRALDHADADVVLVDRHNHHLFQPLLYQVATAGLAAPSIAAPLRYMLRRQRNVTTLLGNVERIDPEARTVHVDGRPLAYDRLVVATGSTHSYFGRDEWARHAPGLKTLDDALRIRERMLTAFERAEAEDDARARDAWLTFVARYVGRALRGELRREGATPPARAPFRYRDHGTLATIGRHAAVVQLRHDAKLTGRVAWWFWVLAHLVYLIGFRNRLVVLIDWAWSYFTWHRAARIVIADAAVATPGEAAPRTARSDGERT